MRRLSWLAALIVLFSAACKNSGTMTQHHAFRLKPGEDLKLAIDSFVKEKQIRAGWISTCVGSLTDYQIRFANQEKGYSDKGHFEIVSLVGTVSINGSHLHISISDSTGKTMGGHLLEGCKIYTTAEIVITSSDTFEFLRAKDGSTPWNELQVQPRK
jgi:predicted DNA-binding protein with PD1-like motif